MYRLMLVEDEPLERQALKMELESGDYGISRIYEASNGREALDIFETERPDILIVDINIPVFSGLELIERVVESGEACKILITTTYDRSRYVRTAISLGVTDYLLKPVDYTELKKAVEKCQALLEAERRQTRKFEQLYSYTQHHVLEGLLSGELNWCDGEIADVMDIELKETLFSSLVVGSPENTHFEHEVKNLLVPDFALLTAHTEDKEIALIHPRGARSREHAVARMRVYLRVLFRNLSAYGNVSLCCCDPIDGFKDLKKSYEKMCENPDREGLRLPAIPSAGLCEPSEKQRLGQKWLNKLYQRDAERLIRSIRRRMVKEDAYWEGAELFCSVFEKMDTSADLIALFQCFEQEKPFEALKQFLSCYYIGHVPEPEKQENSIAERILAVMRREFTRDITQADVAGELYLTVYERK